MTLLQRVEAEPGATFIARRRWPIPHYALECGAAFGSKSGTWFSSGPCRALQDLLVPNLFICPSTWIQPRGRTRSDPRLFLHLLSHKALSQVNPLKGKFRSFLLASLQNYLADEADRARCLKRGGNIEIVPLDIRLAEDRYGLAPLDFLTADKVFDARWAITLMDEAMGRLRQEYAGQGKTSVFETLRPYIDPINSKAALSYEQVAAALHVRVESVKKLIFRLRKRYASVLREEVARTVSDSGQVDEEIHSLCEALIVTEDD